MKRSLLILPFLLIVGVSTAIFYMTRTETRLLGFRSEDGSLAISAELPTAVEGRLAYAGSDIYLLTAQENGVTLSNFDLVGDGLAWTLAISADVTTIRHALQSDWKNVYVSLDPLTGDDALIAVDRDTGEIDWQTTRNYASNAWLAASGVASGEEVVVYVDQFLTHPGARVVARSIRDGSVQWEQPLNDIPLASHTTGDVIGVGIDEVAVMTESGVQLFELASGEPLWERNFANLFGMLVIGNTVIIPQRDEVLGLDHRTGVEKWRILPPSAGNPIFAVYDYSEPGFQEPMLYVEYGVGESDREIGAYEYRSRQLVWQIPHDGTNFVVSPNYNGVAVLHDVAPTQLTTYDRETGDIVWQVELQAWESPLIGDNGFYFLTATDTRWNFWRMVR